MQKPANKKLNFFKKLFDKKANHDKQLEDIKRKINKEFIKAKRTADKISVLNIEQQKLKEDLNKMGFKLKDGKLVMDDKREDTPNAVSQPNIPQQQMQRPQGLPDDFPNPFDEPRAYQASVTEQQHNEPVQTYGYQEQPQYQEQVQPYGYQKSHYAEPVRQQPHPITILIKVKDMEDLNYVVDINMVESFITQISDAMKNGNVIQLDNVGVSGRYIIAYNIL